MLNEGEVTLKLGDREYTLRPTLRAMKNLSALSGGMRGVYTGLISQDFAMVTQVVRHGAMVHDRDIDGLEQAIYKAGINDPVLMPLIEFVRNLMNGGKPPADAPADGPNEPEGNA